MGSSPGEVSSSSNGVLGPSLSNPLPLASSLRLGFALDKGLFNSVQREQLWKHCIVGLSMGRKHAYNARFGSSSLFTLSGGCYLLELHFEDDANLILQGLSKVASAVRFP